MNPNIEPDMTRNMKSETTSQMQSDNKANKEVNLKTNMTPKSLSKKFISFDGQESAQGFLYRADKYRNLEKAMQTAGSPMIPSGAQLSYGLSFAGPGIISLSTEIFNRILEFDPMKETITVESGMALWDLLTFLVSKGFWFPVLPGYPSITIGGCLGSNVHGKSQFQTGNFYDYVEAFTLIHPDHGRMQCSRQNHSDIFELTIGGFGFTGFVAQVKLKIEKLKGMQIQKTTIPVSDLSQAAEVISQHESDCDQIYSWHDLTLSGARFGSGFVYLEKFVNSEGAPQSNITSAMTLQNQKFNADLVTDYATEKINFKNYNLINKLSVLNRHSYKNQLLSYVAPLAVNTAYRFLESLKPKIQTTDVLSAAFPIQGKEIYYDAFGRRGFCEYQMIIPQQHWNEFVKELQNLVSISKIQITLASLKLFKSPQRYLHFASDGVCLAIDVVASPGALEFFKGLDEMVIKFKGLPNIAKDSRIDQRVVAKCFQQYENFKSDLLKFDPKKRFSSSLRDRLGV